MGQPKIALSSSYWDNPAVNAVLKSCDHIYTTQVGSAPELDKEFGLGTVHYIPNCTPSMMSLIKDWHGECEYITFGQLVDIRRNWEKSTFGDSYPPDTFIVPERKDFAGLPVKFYVLEDEDNRGGTIEFTSDDYQYARDYYRNALTSCPPMYIALRYAFQVGTDGGQPNFDGDDTIVSWDNNMEDE